MCWYVDVLCTSSRTPVRVTVNWIKEAILKGKIQCSIEIQYFLVNIQFVFNFGNGWIVSAVMFEK